MHRWLETVHPMPMVIFTFASQTNCTFKLMPPFWLAYWAHCRLSVVGFLLGYEHNRWYQYILEIPYKDNAWNAFSLTETWHFQRAIVNSLEIAMLGGLFAAALAAIISLKNVQRERHSCFTMPTKCWNKPEAKNIKPVTACEHCALGLLQFN